MTTLIDALGPHWTVDGKIYHNQFEAWLAIGRNDSAVARFHLYDDAYDSIDWTQEPGESWDDLLLRRCLQLRNKYQHLCLLYSGGRDSHHVLRSFAKNRIPIDEIIIEDYTLNALKHPEVDYWMIPLAKQYRDNHNPACRISRINVDHNDYEQFFTETWSEQKHFGVLNSQYQPGHHPWLVTRHLPHLSSGTGIIIGMDKPKLIWKDGWIHGYFNDHSFDWYHGSNLSFEFFYFSADLPELHVKQCHSVINWWQINLPRIDLETMNEFTSDVNNPHYDNYSLACGRGPAVDINFQGQNGKNKYEGNHAAMQLVQRLARANKWTSYYHWQENFAKIKHQVPHAFLSCTNKFGYDDPDSKTMKSIPSQFRALRPWTFNQ